MKPKQEEEIKELIKKTICENSDIKKLFFESVKENLETVKNEQLFKFDVGTKVTSHHQLCEVKEHVYTDNQYKYVLKDLFEGGEFLKDKETLEKNAHIVFPLSSCNENV